MATLRAGFLLLLAGAQLAAQPAPLTEAEMLNPPTAARLADFAASANPSGWGALTPMFRAAAFKAYEKGRLPAAERWYYAYRWSALLAETEAHFIPRWMKAMESMQVVHPGIARQFILHQQPLCRRLSPGLQAWLLGDAAFSRAFFSLLSPVDYVPEVFQVFDELYFRDPGRFAHYANLALAIAVVYDLPPPPDWPHGQMAPATIPRGLPRAADAFAWWTRQDQLGRTYQRLVLLGADELKFVVDAAAPFDELEWSQKKIDYPLNELARAYTAVHYRLDRIQGGTYVWPGESYTLPAILSAGGICVDQAYFATQTGKARGVPTLFFRGTGMDGRHAWFGFLDGSQQWQLNAGRYDEQLFVTGYARDPQTWGEISDHELQFLAERFRRQPSFQQSGVHEAFAADYLQGGEAAAAARAARKAIEFEHRNLAAWETLLAAQQALGFGPKQLEATLYEAVAAFARHADLEADFSNRLCQSLQARGQISAANFERERILRKNQVARSDLALQQARGNLQHIMATRPLAESIRAYNSALDSLGRGAGIAFFDQIVLLFVQHLVELDQRTEARQAVERARAVLNVPPGSQLEAEFNRLLASLKPVAPPAP